MIANQAIKTALTGEYAASKPTTFVVVATNTKRCTKPEKLVGRWQIINGKLQWNWQLDTVD